MQSIIFYTMTYSIDNNEKSKNLYLGIELEVVLQQLRLVDMNRLALACVTVVKLVDVVLDDAVGMILDLDGDEHEMRMTCSFVVGAVVDDDDENVAVAWLENDRYFLMNIFELFDHLQE